VARPPPRPVRKKPGTFEARINWDRTMSRWSWLILFPVRIASWPGLIGPSGHSWPRPRASVNQLDGISDYFFFPRISKLPPSRRTVSKIEAFLVNGSTRRIQRDSQPAQRRQVMGEFGRVPIPGCRYYEGIKKSVTEKAFGIPFKFLSWRCAWPENQRVDGRQARWGG